MSSGPIELVVFYEPYRRSSSHRLSDVLLEELESPSEIVRRVATTSNLLLTELGTWAADTLWLRTLRDGTNEQISCLVMHKERICTWRCEAPSINNVNGRGNVTPKVQKLITILASYQSYGEHFRGVIFGAHDFGEVVFLLLTKFQSIRGPQRMPLEI
jgi:hypothetical protein